jgi:hypothetical protein
MPRFADHLTDIGDILLSTAENGEVRVNVGDVLTKAGYDTNASVWGPDGYIAMPNDPSDDGAARALYLLDGNNRRVFGFTDNRFAAQAGTLQPGDRRIVTDGPTRIYITKATAQVGLYTEAENEPPVGGKGMILDLNGSEGVIQIRSGGCLIVLDGQNSKITISASGASGNAAIVIDPVNGISLLAGTVNLDAGFTTLGLNSDGTRPGKPGIDTVLIGAMGQSGVASPKCYAPQY